MGNNCAWGRYTNGLTLTTLVFTALDGTEYELRDQGTFGRPMLAPGSCDSLGYNRGTVFVTADGSSATFISDSPVRDIGVIYVSDPPPVVSGYLMLRDGTRFRIENWQLAWARDRNGNQLTFQYYPEPFYYPNANIYTDGSFKLVSKITDSLGREVNFRYNVAGPAPYGVHDEITYAGFGGQPRVVRVSHARMADALRADQTIKTVEELFPYLNYDYYDMVRQMQFNPTVISTVWLPDGKSYRVRYNSYGEGRKGYTETWQNAAERLHIKHEAAKNAGLQPGSYQPRFDWKIGQDATGRNIFWDPFTGLTGPKGALSHVPLEPPISAGVGALTGIGTGTATSGVRLATGSGRGPTGSLGGPSFYHMRVMSVMNPVRMLTGVHFGTVTIRVSPNSPEGRVLQRNIIDTSK